MATSYKVSALSIYAESGTDNKTIRARWQCSLSHIDSYKVEWRYKTSDGKTYIGAENNVNHVVAGGYISDSFSRPDNAKVIYVRVKPVSKKKSKGKSYWTGVWSDQKSLTIGAAITMTVPSVSLDRKQDDPTGLYIVASVSNYANSTTYPATHIKFWFVPDNDTKKAVAYTVAIKAKAASAEHKMTPGHTYTVYAKAVKGDNSSAASPYTSAITARPDAPERFYIPIVQGKNVRIRWAASIGAAEYQVQCIRCDDTFPNWTVKLDSLSDAQNHIVNDMTVTGCEATFALDYGATYTFRVRASNSNGTSPWHNGGKTFVTLAMKPDPPTTWSSTTSTFVGDDVIFFWIHNSKDGSREVSARFCTTLDGWEHSRELIVYNSVPAEEDIHAHSLTLLGDIINKYKLYTAAELKDGAHLEWRVSTRGIGDDWMYESDLSITRVVDIYERPTILADVFEIGTSGGERVANRLPFTIDAFVSPMSQNVLSYSIKLYSNSNYLTRDIMGRNIAVTNGQTLYSKVVITSEEQRHELRNFIIPTQELLLLENGNSYTIEISAAMDSGLVTTPHKIEFTVQFEELNVEYNAETFYDDVNKVLSITPFYEQHVNANEYQIFVFRINYDGTFTEIGEGAYLGTEGSGVESTVIDPHPTLGSCWYRLVAMSLSTGACDYMDIDIDVPETSVIIQWGETWTSYENNLESTEDEPDEGAYGGSMLELPYNIKVSNSFDNDVELVEYIGRTNPVSYYGTQTGETATWSMEIPKTDDDTIRMLRRLTVYNGDCYVREPNGTGYWANVKVSYSTDYDNLVVPIQLSISRVEGGV